MIRSLEKVLGYTIRAEDGEIGHAHDMYFDDATWMIRYLVVDTGNWLPGRKVLVSPLSVGSPSWEQREIPVKLTRERVEKSPSIALDLPVSRQEEGRLHEYFGWEPYWLGHMLTGPGPAIPPGSTTVEERADESDAGRMTARRDQHLRSVQEVLGYDLAADDGDIGHVADFLVNDEIWGLKYFVVDTRKWLPGRKVLVSPMWITKIDWAARKVRVDLSREEIRSSPEWDPAEPVNAEYEKRLFDSYGRPAPAGKEAGII